MTVKLLIGPDSRVVDFGDVREVDGGGFVGPSVTVPAELADGFSVVDAPEGFEPGVHGCVYEDGNVVVLPAPPIEKTRDQLKQERDQRVAGIQVTTAAGVTFDGDEVSQGRMARAILALKAAGQESTMWVLADNEKVLVSVVELEEALILAGQAQTALWPI